MDVIRVKNQSTRKMASTSAFISVINFQACTRVYLEARLQYRQRRTCCLSRMCHRARVAVLRRLRFPRGHHSQYHDHAKRTALLLIETLVGEESAPPPGQVFLKHAAVESRGVQLCRWRAVVKRLAFPSASLSRANNGRPIKKVNYRLGHFVSSAFLLCQIKPFSIISLLISSI